ncbi:MAG: hypothetical protein ABFS35_04215 [Bacteroidota bacterium]
MKKYYFLVFSLIITILIFYKVGIFDRLNLITNKISIKNNIKNTKLSQQIKIIMPNSPKIHDTIVLYENNKIRYRKTKDWYGKDYIEVIYRNNRFRHSFNIYKFHSWHKVEYKLNINSYSTNYILLEWKLSTKWYDNFGTDTIILSPANRGEK